jgi:DNA-binding transcriptional MocR family regulator
MELTMPSQTLPKIHPDFHYVKLADEIEDKVAQRIYKTGEKLPSIRDLHRQLGLSISTIHQTYIELEKRGIVESRVKSGFYIKPIFKNVLPQPSLKRCCKTPKKVTINALADEVKEAITDPGILNLGSAVPDKNLFPAKHLARLVKSISMSDLDRLLLTYEKSDGAPDLKRQIARRSLGNSQRVTEEEILITNGCIEAVSFCLRAVAKPGDTIVVESPTYYGFLQLLEELKMFTLELPTDPETGPDLNALKQALAANPVKACLFTLSFQHPLGYMMPDKNKKELIDLLNSRDVPIIEDDLFGELYFGKTRPATLKSFDTKGLVLYCSSISKTLGPGIRIGWTMPGRYYNTVRRLKRYSSLSSPGLNQHLIAEFLKSGSYDRHLRSLRNALKNQMSNMTLAIKKYFPENTKVTAPKGGLLLWLELNKNVDSLELYQEALRHNIAILPGILCSSTPKYRNYIRLSCGLPWSDKVEKGVATLGNIITKMKTKG